ncbi:uncharacterized protein LOC126964098 [Macaca thibetana thibetana]|uniref:uncharacterized protein LOC126964098 n=1 Tax=Macaca thibetana thibetana TaxID=257877 RepID=UPI0021BCE455|nr:uncharacterized protein LOC126964098 [Macaca thibetana thibetana]
MADEHQEGTLGTSTVFHPGIFTMETLVLMGLVSRRSQLLGIRGRTHRSREAGPAGRGSFCDTDGITGLWEVTQLPELTQYHSAPKPHGKNAPRPSDLNSSTGSSPDLQIPDPQTPTPAPAPPGSPAPPSSNSNSSTSSRVDLQLNDSQTWEAAPAPHQGSSSTTLKLEQQHRLLPGSPAPSNFNDSTGSSPGPPAPHPPTYTVVASAPPSVSSSTTIKLELQHQLLFGLQLHNPQTTIATPVPP